jgi:phospholipid/cholesterol/gamma-HCH transport system ATP-binding protein
MSAPLPAIVFRGVDRSFGPTRVVFRDLSLELPAHGVSFVVGSTGAGKTVLCRMAVGLDRPDAGEVFLLGEPLHQRSDRELLLLRRRAPYLVQGPALLDWLTLRGNVAVAAPHAPDKVEQALGRVGLSDLAGRLPGELGPGLAKRAAIARALVLDPELLVLDEPTTGLDARSAAQVATVLSTLKQEGLGAVVVSHDYRLLGQLADRVLLVTGKAGARLYPTREAFLRSEDPEVRALLAPIEAEVVTDG